MPEQTDIFLHYIRPYLKGMHTVSRQYTVCGEDALDLVQETLLRAWKSFSSTEEREYRPAWLFVIMRNVAVDWQQRSKRRIRSFFLPHSELAEIATSDLTEAFCPMPAMSEEQFREFLDDRVAAALDALKTPYREVIILSVAGGLNYREIAEVLDCPVGTVMSRMARARRFLREHLANLAGNPKKVIRRAGEVNKNDMQ